MALKPTIYKVQLELADSDRNLFRTLNPVLARHPSETLERLTARLLAFCLQASDSLEFTRGLSTADEPDLWQHADSGEIEHWIEVGQPDEQRLRKACGRANQVTVYAYGRSTDTWWKLNGGQIGTLPHLRAWQLTWSQIEAAARLIERTVKLNVSIVGGVIYLDNGSDSTSVEPLLLYAAE